MLVATPFIIRLLTTRITNDHRKTWCRINIGQYYLAELMMCLAWLFVGFGYSLGLRALQPLNIQQWIAGIFANTTAYLVSLVTFIVPAGIGVRETVAVYSMSGIVEESTVLLGALLGRLILIGSELLGFLLAAGYAAATRMRKHNKQ